MSEYQYWEFQALDRPLTHEAQAEMRSLSSGVTLTATSASFVYNCGHFRGNPYQVLAKHFDAMLYITNWGTRQLMFGFPANAIPDDVMSAYQYADSLEWSAAGQYIILNMEHHEGNGHDGWIVSEGLLPGIVQVREDILHGDWRALYLAWLKFAHSGRSQYPTLQGLHRRLKAAGLIFASTYSNYGIGPDDALVDETSPLNPQLLYAETKVR